MTSALIGHTGFVGSNLARQRAFDRYYNSSNIGAIRGSEFELVVCAGARAEKWKANADPTTDASNIHALMEALKAVEARRFVLISTVDVFARPVGVDEASDVVTVDLHPYGLNRRRLEELVESRFRACVVRLPGLYGKGLKKNVIYDFLNDNETHVIDSRAVYQFYGIDRLWSDVLVALENDLPLVHLATEPVSVADVARHAFGFDFTNEVSAAPPLNDMRTKYAGLFGGRDGYIEDRERELGSIAAFVRMEAPNWRRPRWSA